MTQLVFADEALTRTIEADLAFQAHLDRLWGARFMLPHIGTGGYYEIQTTHGLEILSGWEVGPRELYEISRQIRSRRLNHLLTHRLLDSALALPEAQYGTLGRLVPCDVEHPQYRQAHTPWLVGDNRWDVAKKLWDKYGYVTR